MSIINIGKTIINVVTRNCFLATIELKDDYYSLSISRLFQTFLKFKLKDKLYCFTRFPNGIESCPRKFTKLNKVPIRTLHFENVPLSGYIDDLFNEGETFSIYEEIIHKTMRLYDKLDFVVNFKMPLIVPMQRIKILGFLIYSLKMMVTLTEGN